MTKKKRFFLQIAIVLALLAAGGAGLATLVATRKPPAKQQTEVLAPLVQAAKTSAGAHELVVRGEGTVRPLRQSDLATQVAGEVLWTSPSLRSGGSFKKDQVLLKIDPEDYRLAVTLARAEVAKAHAELKVAQQETEASREEWRKLYGSDQGEPPPLVAKEPQLAAKQAALQAARAKLRQAELDLARTEIKAPFEGRVVSKAVDVGQTLGVNKTVATVYSTDAAEITVPLESSELAWLKVPGLTTTSGEGSPATVSAEFAGQANTWRGRVVRAEGQVDARTRLVPVVVQVNKPFASLPPLTPGLFTTVEIGGHTLEEATVVPRAALRAGDVVWVVRDGRIEYVPVKVVHRYMQDVVVSPPLPQGAVVVTSSLKAVSDGMKVRVSLNDAEGKDRS